MSDYRKSFAHICESNTCDNCKFNIDENEQYTCSYEGFYKHGYQQGKEDAIEELDKLITDFCDSCSDDCYYCHINKISEFAEQIKEKKNGL